MTIARKIFTKQIAALIAVLVLTLGVAASCEQGTYQGGGDSVPHYRR